MSRILYIQKHNKSPNQKIKDVHRDGLATEKETPGMDVSWIQPLGFYASNPTITEPGSA